MRNKLKVNNIWNKFLLYGIDIVFIIILVYYAMSISIYQCENPKFKTSLLVLIIFVLLYLLFYKMFNKIKNYKFFIFLMSFFMYLLWNAFAKTELVSDYKVLVDGAQAVINRHI